MRFDFQLQFIIIFLSACFVRSKTISSYEKLCSSLHLRLRKKKTKNKKEKRSQNPKIIASLLYVKIVSNISMTVRLTSPFCKTVAWQRDVRMWSRWQDTDHAFSSKWMGDTTEPDCNKQFCLKKEGCGLDSTIKES